MLRTFNEQPDLYARLGISNRNTVAPEGKAARRVLAFSVAACVEDFRPLPFVPGLLLFRKAAHRVEWTLTLRVQVLTRPLSPSVMTPASRSIHATAVTCMLCASFANSVWILLFHIRTLLS